MQQPLQEQLKQALQSNNSHQKLEQLLAKGNAQELSGAVTALQNDPTLDISLKLDSLNQFSAMLRFKQALHKAMTLTAKAYVAPGDYQAIADLQNNFNYQHAETFINQLAITPRPAPTPSPSPSPAIAHAPQPKPRKVPEFMAKLNTAVLKLEHAISTYNQQAPKPNLIQNLHLTPQPPG